MTDSHRAITVVLYRHGDTPILYADGILDSSTYRGLRDTVIKAALDEPSAVIVDVNRLAVPSPSAWSVFTSARWHVNIWPDVPVALVCGQVAARREIAACGVTRYVPVYPTHNAALAVTDSATLDFRRRDRAAIPRSRVGIRLARARVREWLTAWSVDHLIPAASTVATVFVENVLEHTASAPVLIVESFKDAVTIAVEDCSQVAAVRHEQRGGAESVSGLAIVSCLCRAWGSAPTPTGKTVWALVGSENRL